jgi:predicted GNAT superfamily acetyltransferase
LVLGAFEEGELIGFLFAVPYLVAGRKPCHWMHMLGVDPRCQSKDVGFELLKSYAKELRRLREEFGLEAEVWWTYPPLEGKNANLYLRKAGAVAVAYLPGVYGEQPGIYRGLSTHRFKVRWFPLSERTRTRMEDPSSRLKLADVEGLPWATHVEIRGEVQHLVDINKDIDSKRFLLEIPSDLTALKDLDLQLARDWQERIGDALDYYFDKGYQVVDFISEGEGNQRRNVYLLELRGNL